MSQEREFEVFPDMIGRLSRVGEAMIADNAVVVGDVRLGADANVWFGVVLRGDDCRIEVGEGTNVQDNTVVHADPGVPLRIGKGVTIGHGVVAHGAEIGDYTLVGMGALLLAGSRVGRRCVIGAGAVVPEGSVIPDRSVVLGVPASVRRQVTDEEAAALERSAAHYVERARTYLATS